MKKRIVYLIIILLLTGCTCEYNLNIENDVYSENIIFDASDSNEVNNFSKEYKIPIDIDEYNNIYEGEVDTLIYETSLNDGNLKFSYKFNNEIFSSSTALNFCFDKTTITSYNENIIISTSDEFLCFDNYPNLTNVKVNITTDNEVVSSDADSVLGNTYTWVFTKSDNVKGINIVLKEKVIDNVEENNDNSDNKYNFMESISNIYSAIILVVVSIVMFLGYFLFLKFKDKNSKLDD